MQQLSHDAAAVGIGVQITGNGARGIAAGTAATAAAGALVPAGADEVSAVAATAFAADAARTFAVNALAQEEIGRAGAAIIEITGTYQAVDCANAAALA
ncbi:MAG: PE domain-containing protein [Mycolicibacterium sp.]|uniref:PE domain-containing protein n=1 Tax=Mycolicibacterium sp. TaxID=2320850 RepID=UPI003D0A52DF